MPPRKKQGENTPPRNEIILQKPMEEIMHDSMIPYAEYVILERALPRVEDGLKPVQRRILYTMMELALSPDKPHRKSARIVGDALGKYHPHGDGSVYDAMVRMAQPFNMRGLLVDGHGNFGSVDGDSAAAMRYTEARMAPLAMELLRDIDKDTVDFSLNFDDTLREPKMLPGRYPNLLVNGASGIAVGLATNIPPHNLGEAIAAAIAVMDRPMISLAELMESIPAPDFPTGGELIWSDEIAKAYETGRGRLLLRAKTAIERLPGGKSAIAITELPYQVNKAGLLEKIQRLTEEKKGVLTQIADIRDESDRSGMRAVIELKRDAEPERVLAYLYKVSDLQIAFGVNMVAIAEGKPMLLGLKALLERYVAYQKAVVTRRSRHELNQAEARAHVLEGLIRAVDLLDEIIALIRASKSPREAREALVARFAFSEIQAQAILDLRLQRLTGLEILALRREGEDLAKEIKRLNGILSSDEKLRGVLRAEMLEIKQKYADARRTKLILGESVPEFDFAKEERQGEPCAMIWTAGGMLKRMAPRLFQRREESEDAPRASLEMRTDESLLLFTSKGACHTIEAGQIPEAKWKDRGLSLSGLVQGLESGESLIAWQKKKKEGEGELLFFTAQGQAKRTALSEFGARKGRAAAISLKNGDELLAVEPYAEGALVLLLSARGMSLCFRADEISLMGRAAAGVRAMTLEPGDRLRLAAPAAQGAELFLLSDRGYVKRCLALDFEPQRRGGKGVKAFPFNKNGSNGEALAVAELLNEPCELLVAQKDGTKTRVRSEEAPLRPKGDKGAVFLPVFLDNIVTGAQRLEERAGEKADAD
ncbi:MAG: DNA topoisomerase 4 subunit A [Christensenellaceae bacterium]|jgi:DNA gyrase subunit A|nr:DNA topoisomerase 4 subunit A [Christensenellaceae bacterium]